MSGKSKWMLAAACAMCLGAQAPQEPIVRVTTRLVEINAVVRDRTGPVEGLTKDDFTLFDNGKPQKIALFSVNSTRAPQKAPAPLPPNVFSNVPGERSQSPGSATVVLLDSLHTPALDQPYASRQLAKFLKQIRPEDRVAVYALGHKIIILNDFTNDSERLQAAVARYGTTSLGVAETTDPDSSDYNNSALLGAPAEVLSADLQGALADASAALQDFATLTSGELTVAALEAIADHLGHLPGRKSLVWITNQIPLNIDQALRLGRTQAADRSILGIETFRAVKALNDANIAVYPVDARGLVGPPPSMSAKSGPVTLAQARQGLNTSSMSVAQNHEPMIALAKATGGLPFYNTNDIGGAIRRAVDDSEVTYTLGFYPGSNASDASFHELKLQVARKGLELRYRGGYRANPETQTSEKERTELLRDALWSPLEASAVGLKASVDKVEQPKPGSLRITLGVTPADIQLDQKDGKWSGVLDYVIAQRAADGHFLSQSPKAFTLNLNQDQYQAMMTAGFNVTNTVERLGGAVEIRVVLLDQTSGKIGSVIIPLKP
jgi:VWFA-related protein